MEEDKQSKKFELLALHIEMFQKAFAGYIEYYESLRMRGANAAPDKFGDEIADIGGSEGPEDGELNDLLFEEIICNYYETVISALKKLTKYDRKYLGGLIKMYEKLWISAPKLKDRDYLCPYLSDLCKFLYEIKEAGTLTFFYNLLIYCREIPFLSLHCEQEKRLASLYAQNKEDDPFGEFRQERKKRIINGFDEGLFNAAYDKFFLMLSGWNDKAEGYYAKDEIYFMNGLFILDELTDYIYFEEENGGCGRNISGTDCLGKGNGRAGVSDGALRNHNDHDNSPEAECKMFQKVIRPDGCENVYRYVYDDAMKEKISCFYEKALRYFNRAINYNQNNPRYYYEYARCLKNFGKSGEAEIFFKKAFDLK